METKVRVTENIHILLSKEAKLVYKCSHSSNCFLLGMSDTGIVDSAIPMKSNGNGCSWMPGYTQSDVALGILALVKIERKAVGIARITNRDIESRDKGRGLLNLNHLTPGFFMISFGFLYSYSRGSQQGIKVESYRKGPKRMRIQKHEYVVVPNIKSKEKKS